MTDEIVPGLTVSRETADRLRSVVDDVRRWTLRINLIAKGTSDGIWVRHVCDSDQCLLPATQPGPLHWLDLGGGGGFPGLVLAILLAEVRPDDRMTLVERDRRKGAFLQQAAGRFAPQTRVCTDRAENISPAAANVITARALAPLARLLPLIHRHAAPGAMIILPKGRRSHEELVEARWSWQFSLAQRPSLVDPEGTILILSELRETPIA